MTTAAAAERVSVVTESLTASGQARVGAPAPWLAGWTLDDKVWNLRKAFADTMTDRVALVFFATWCAPCREGIRQLAARAADLRAARVSVVLVNYQEDAPRVRGFLDGPPAFPVVVDRFGACETAYLRSGDDQVRLPRTVVVGRDLAVRAIYGAEGPDYVDRIIGGR
ncbi:MAG: redoxin family protein [Betaproteobacteria bacterium]|nr:redoxin family protein [Betaproteobacteria bacterium]